ncbi:triose-phosphate transporter family-domain-containing protein [Exophiala viscosa]|uniref:triose-phosphate transporter family-domain-containing protein n=1 Tax=Exophiala viscosa TaxID=2486360 RepID=UPI00219B4A95|nr:triose-phosphate transporter family-domain-containing protein [Exophiala viscosa]
MAAKPYRDHIQRTSSSAAPSTPTENKSTVINPRRKFRRRGTGSTASSDDEAVSYMSESEEHELDALDSDVDLEDDEEAGLNKHERQKYMKRKRQRDGLDARIAGTARGSKDEAKEADKSVLHRLLVNASLIGLWYIFSLSISIYNKMMFSSDHIDFPFPLFATSLHMLVQFSLASIVLLIFPHLRPTQPQPSTYRGESHSSKRLVTPLFYFTRLVPTGTTTSLDIGLGNTSLRYITLTFYTMCKSSVLIFVLAFAFIFRLEKLSLKLILIILTMTIGVLMMVAGETSFHALGFALAISASFFSGFRWGLTQILLLRHPATSNPFATLFFLSPIMFVTLMTIACISETPAAVVTGIEMLISSQGLLKALLLLFIPGCLAFCMIASEFTLLQRTSVVTLSICGIFKEVVTISAAGIVFHDELSMVNISGLLVTICSIASYNYMKIMKMRQEARDKLKKKDEDDDEVIQFDDDAVDGAPTSLVNPEGRSEDLLPLMHDRGPEVKDRTGGLGTSSSS